MELCCIGSDRIMNVKILLKTADTPIICGGGGRKAAERKCVCVWEGGGGRVRDGRCWRHMKEPQWTAYIPGHTFTGHQQCTRE